MPQDAASIPAQSAEALPAVARPLVATHWGLYRARMENGAAAALEPFEGDPDPSPIGSAMLGARLSPARIMRPAVRKSFLEKGPRAGGEGRGGEPFVEVDWDTALSLVAGELDRVRKEHGNQAIYGGSYGWGSAGRFHHAGTHVHRFLNAIGGYTRSVQNYSFAAADVILPHVLGTTQGLAAGHTPWSLLAGHSQLVVAFGGLPLRNAQVSNGSIVRHSTKDSIRAIRDAGARFVNISPLRDDTLAEIGAEWHAPRPNTDTAIMLGLAHVLISDGLADRGFIEQYTVGFDRLSAYIRGESDGTPKTPEWAAEISGIGAETIRALAREMAAKRTLVTVSWSLQRADHGEQPIWMAVALAAMLGQIGLPGGGVGFGYSVSGGIGRATSTVAWPSMAQGKTRVDAFIPVSRITDMLLGPGTPFDYNGKRYTYPEIKLIYWAGGNPFHHHQDLNRLIAGWRRPDTVIVHEHFWTAAARHADIVIPAATMMERNDVAASGRDNFLAASHRVADPPGDVRTDYEVFRALAERLGGEPEYSEGRDEAGWVRHIYDDARKRAAAAGQTLPEFETFWRDGVAEVATQPAEPLLARFRADPQKNKLATPSGRIELYSERIASFGYDDCLGHPAWLAPKEWLGAPQARHYPLHLLSNQPSHKLHSQYDHGSHARSLKIQGREPVRIHPADAARRGIAQHEIVRVFNARGSLLAAAVLDDGVREGVLQLATGSWYDPAEPGQLGALDKHGNPNVLTPDHGTSKLAQAPSANSCLVDIERWTGELPPITCYDAPPLVSRSPSRTG
jgi:biotin/methionine sulfoxide reductase